MRMTVLFYKDRCVSVVWYNYKGESLFFAYNDSPTSSNDYACVLSDNRYTQQSKDNTYLYSLILRQSTVKVEMFELHWYVSIHKNNIHTLFIITKLCPLKSYNLRICQNGSIAQHLHTQKHPHLQHHIWFWGNLLFIWYKNKQIVTHAYLIVSDIFECVADHADTHVD